MALARVYPCSFSYKLVYEIKFDAPIRVHHAYKDTWTPQKDHILYCKKDYPSEALDIDKHVMGLVGHVPIELSRIISYFLQESETNKVEVAVNGKRRRELDLVVPGKNIRRSTQDNQTKVYSFLLAIRRAKKCIIKYPLKNKTS